MLIDGERIGSANSGDVAFSRIPLLQIERVEILRGPVSSLYGADAIGGVIQIFTKKESGAPLFNSSTGHGTNNTSDTSAGVSGGTKTVSYSVQTAHYQTDGINSRSNPGIRAFNPDRDGFHNDSVSGSLTFRSADGHAFGLNILSSNGINQYDDGTSSSRLKDYSIDQSISAYSAYSRNRLAPSWTSTDDSTSRTNGIATSVYKTEQDQLSWQNDIKLPVGTALLAAEYLNQKLSSTAVFQTNERTIRSLSAGWGGSLGNHRLQGNLRRYENSQFGGKTTGFAGYGYQFSQDWRGHLSYGTAFRAPTFNELYSDGAPYGAKYAGNPNLKPELARNREIGFDWGKPGHYFSAVYFNNKVSDLIVGYPLQNVSDATIDLQRPRDDATGKRLTRRADQQFKSHIGYCLGPWTFGGEWQVVGERFEDTANTKRLGGYGLVNLNVEYCLEKDGSLFARTNNVFDKQYELAKDYATLGTNVFVGIRYQPK